MEKVEFTIKIKKLPEKSMLFHNLITWPILVVPVLRGMEPN